MVLDAKAELQLQVAHAPDALLLRSCKYVEVDAAFDLECCRCIEDFDRFGPVLLAHDWPIEFHTLAILEASIQVPKLAESILECVVSQRFHLLVVISRLSMYDEISICVGPDPITDVLGKPK